MESIDPTPPVRLACPECGFAFDPTSAASNETPGVTRCSKCAAIYPKACYECGNTDAPFLRPLGGRGTQPGDAPLSAYFCPDCVESYERMAVREAEKIPCARCHRLMPRGTLRVRSFNKTQVSGILAHHETLYQGVCPTCADKVDSKSSKMLLCFAALLVGFLLFVLVCWLLN